jgi:hypothetical protein
MVPANYLLGDIMYSGGLAQIGFVAGAAAEHEDARYHMDGKRFVMFFATRPLSMSDVDVLPWELPAAPQPGR